ncbi:polysaccharide biosynthesis/export family protein [Sphingorhabdus profundilacus]|jgi:protein involved in polysaccharide export with SLBB domain|nr:polysaccharide biosynthesis/export family protein [Sphingorhabdus profundilacus]
MTRFFIALLLILTGACTPVAMMEGPSVANYVYRIGSGDRLKIQTFGESTLSGEFAVNAEGSIAFPLVGDVMAGGKTVTEFKEDLTNKLGSQYLRNPRISVEMVNFRPVYILGEVAKPGEFNYSERMSVFALVAKAGGFTYRANQSYAYIRREDETEEKAIKLTSATAVQPGDTVRIPDRVF